MNDGLPLNEVTTENFRLLIQRATSNPDATIIAAKTYCTMLKVSFSRFCAMMKRLLEEEFEFAHRFPFLNLLHDLCTTSNGKRSLVGSGSHNSAKVETIITLRIAELYGLAIDCMTQFLMSDTTPSARKISKLYDDTVQLDCTMHVLNLCRVYGLGVPENVKNVCIGDPETNISAKQRRVCTPGGPFQKAHPWS
ncbi:hypothetical protein PC111_g13331 [Phytophthora cactorum]|nr:hypothetical protein PC111_g13331 [Phytophthora cactorum]KAG3077680.1 hypothetical protein PC122_g13033 [Phytophthora cactorum]KAG3157774.1 hypothetical protein C6341_g14644 [Phytophthora cactorum]